YCLPFLNGQLETQGSKPEVMEGFVATKVKMDIAGSMVDTIKILPSELDLKGDSPKPVLYPWGEEETLNIMKYKKNGKQVKDYKLIISRDKSGNLISISKKPRLLQDFKTNSDTLYFKPQKDTCIPEKYIGNNKLKFSVDLCREIDRFFAENPKAKECLVSRDDQKLASLVREHAKSLGEKVILGLEKQTEDMSALYAAKHRVDCSEAGVDGILGDKAIWDNYIGKRGEEKLKSSAGEEE
ncbi:MAG: hypothetical protein H0V66_07630, partial [Bdellovibrionales bacterium]|nr:hypothetical protein [Bdellovibrionales bacterium]